MNEICKKNIDKRKPVGGEECRSLNRSDIETNAKMSVCFDEKFKDFYQNHFLEAEFCECIVENNANLILSQQH